MTSISLYSAPGTCSRVTTIALEEIGVEFESKIVAFMKGEHKSPEFKKLNPKGKVPCLVIDDEALSENVAMLSYLNTRFPDAKLLPESNNDMDKMRQIADLCFCSATLHPLVTRIRIPPLFAGPENSLIVWQKACESMREYFQLIEDRLQDYDWWYGNQWSVMDAYIYWVFWRVEGANFPINDYPRFCDHAQRMSERPSTIRAIAREDIMTAELEAKGLLFTPPQISIDS
jgi:glutathione S-transferase